jgi:hypothetical protein
MDIFIPVIVSILSIFGTGFAIWYKNYIDKKKIEAEECPVGKCVTEDARLLDFMDSLLLDVKADRVSIYSFHNGGIYWSGKSMQKMSMSYEVTSSGISTEMLSKQNIPVSACIGTLKPLMTNGHFHHINVNDYPEGLCKYHLIESGVISTYQWAIMSLSGKMIGMLRIDYIKKAKKLTDDEYGKLKIFSDKLPGYLS